jgi:CRISPR-associated helicase Cas3/CRISPR-associated endonuclease Cas3-HD
MKYYAHSSNNPEKSWQTIVEHLENTAKIAGDYASRFNAREFGYICGILHDIGKYSQDFQKKLHGEILNVDHSSAGAQVAKNLYGEAMGKLLSYCIAGHHSGLLNHGTPASTEGTLYARLHKNLEDFNAYKNELEWISNKKLPNFPITLIDREYQGFMFSFFVRMIFSCLVDADFIDTENYLSNVLKPRGSGATVVQLNTIFSKFILNLSNDKTKINTKRREILERCLHMANSNPGLFTLTVPTGGGKTYSSLAFALNHAAVNNLERIIYVIPYTSIIEQNAKVFKDVLGDENILEHHCNYQFDSNNSENLQSVNEKLKLASENWDIPIVVTTNVQFFESLFSNRSSKCRKIHNLSKSVIIFDEAQMLPIQYLIPCLLAVSELVKNYGTTAVLCTATQPSVNELLPLSIRPVEMMHNPRQLYNDFKKVKIIKKDKMNDDDLANEINKIKQVLCIVNTRKHAKEIFNKLKGKNNTFHLSSLMCPIHRQETFRKIRQNLKDKKPCKVISTQLIEAGVDVDFPIVYRAIAGIDSIVQSAGRCNREGKLETGYVFIFDPVSEYAKIRGYLERTASVAHMVLRKYEDPISLEAIDYYFKMLYDIEGKKALDKKDILDCFEAKCKQLEFDFQTAAERFKLIESNTYSIIVPYKDNGEKDDKKNIIKLLNEAKYTSYPINIARKLQPYTVPIYENEYKVLQKNGVLKTINDSFIVLENYEGYYDKNTGLIIPTGTYGEGIFV